MLKEFKKEQQLRYGSVNMDSLNSYILEENSVDTLDYAAQGYGQLTMMTPPVGLSDSANFLGAPVGAAGYGGTFRDKPTSLFARKK